MRALLTLTLMFALFAAGLAAQTPDEQAIIDLVAAYNDARETRDPAAIDALFTDDADQLVSSGEWRRGRDTLVKGMLGSSQRNPGTRTLTVETVRFVSDEVAIADARYEIAGADSVRKMWSTFLAKKEDGRWRIAAIRNMLPARMSSRLLGASRARRSDPEYAAGAVGV